MLTGTEYLRDFEMVFGYDAADEHLVDPDSVYSMTITGYDKEDEEAVNEFKARLEFKRRKRQKKIDKYNSLRDTGKTEPIPVTNDLQENQDESREEETYDEAELKRKFNAFKKKKKKNLSEMTHYERKHEISSDMCCIEQSIHKFNVNVQHLEFVSKWVMNTWLVVNRKDVADMKSKSAFYNLFMHISVVFKYIQDGLSGVVDRLEDLYSNKEKNPPLSGTEICSRLSVNTKYYTSCCTIFRQIMKFAIEKGHFKGL
jgi:hypothetical protein